MFECTLTKFLRKLDRNGIFAEFRRLNFDKVPEGKLINCGLDFDKVYEPIYWKGRF